MIRIRKTPYTNPRGIFPVHSDEVRAQLGVIAGGGSNELPASYGDHDDPADPDNYSLVDFDPGPVDVSTPSGKVKDRLRTLVTQTERYEIIGMGWDFVFGDGTTVHSEAGVTLGTTVFYDTTNCNGDGRWIVDTAGNHACTLSSVILYHELGGHAFLDQPPDLPTADAEQQAIHEENDLRVAMGLTPRDEHRLASGCGCPDSGCCIVASVATGSPYSEEVNTLRQLRDQKLRSSRIGEVLFDQIHSEYYAFSPMVCRVLIRDVKARSNVENWLVQPLVQVLQLAHDYSRAPSDFAQLGARFLSFPVQEEVSWKVVNRFLAALSQGEVPSAALDTGTGEVCLLLAQWIPRSPHVLWAIVEPLRIYATARFRFRQGDNPEEAGKWLAAAFTQWLSTMPLDALISHLMPSEITRDIQNLDGIIGIHTAANHIRERLLQVQPLIPWKRGSMKQPHFPLRIEQIRCAHIGASLQTSVTVANTGDRPFHLVTELRRILLDPATGVLTLWLSERQPPRDESRPGRHITQPKTQVIDPGRNIAVKFELPHRMTKLLMGPENRFDFEPLDLSQARSVVFKISADDKPFYANPRNANLREQLANWGKDLVTKAVPIEVASKH